MIHIKTSLQDTIFRPIVCEAKESFEKLSMSFDEFCSDKKNLSLEDKEIVELKGFKEKYRDGDAIVIATQSFKAGYEWAMNHKDDVEYQDIYVVLPFENLNVVIEIQKRNGKHHHIYIFVVGPKNVNIKSCTNNSSSAWKYAKEIYLDNDISDEEVFEMVYKNICELNKRVGNAFDSATIEAIKNPSVDKSPYTLSKKKRFPDWVKHAYVKAQGKDFIYKNTWNGVADIFVQTVKLDGKNYYKVLIGDADKAFQNGSNTESLAVYYLTTLGQLDKFLEFTLKPHRMKMNSELGEDGEIHVWYSKMNKNLPNNLKKDIIKDEDIIKKCKFKEMDIFKLYKGK